MDNKIGFQTRHLAKKMQKLREGNLSHYEITKYLEKIAEERIVLIEQFQIFASYLGRNIFLKDEIPLLTVEEAKKHVYLTGYTSSDFELCVTYKIAQENPQMPPPSPRFVNIFIMMLQAAINDLSWAIGELNAYLSE